MTDNPLFDTILVSGDITKRANPQVMDWTTTYRRQGKSRVITELKKRLGQTTTPDKITGYSCDMIIIDDEQYGQPIFLAPTTDGTDPMQKLLDDYKAWYDKVVALQFSIPESAIKGSVSGSVFFNEAELTAQSFDEKLQKTWGRNY
jgi:hypothetical protein